MGFDNILFMGGLQAAGILSSTAHGCMRYKINKFSGLDTLLGKGWHFRGINEHGDYAHVDLQSVEFYLSKQCKFVEYTPPQSADGTIQKVHTDVGYSLSFSLNINGEMHLYLEKIKIYLVSRYKLTYIKCLLLLYIIVLVG